MGHSIVTNERALLFGLLGAALLLFAWGRVRYDAVAVPLVLWVWPR